MNSSSDDIAATLEHRLAAAGLVIASGSAVELRGGLDNRLVAVQTVGGERLIVKIRRDGQARYAVADWATRQLTAVGVPCPRIVWHDSHLCVQTRCPGRALADSWNVLVEPSSADVLAAADAGRLLRRVHAVPTGGFGRLDAAGTGRHRSHESWLLGVARAPTAAAGHDLSDLWPRARARLQAETRRLSGARPRLLHGDWGARHVLVDAGRVTAIVDLDSSRGGDPLCDVAGWSLQEPSRLTHALLDGYFPEPPDTFVRFALAIYRVRIGMSLLAYHAACGDSTRVNARARQVEDDLEDLEAGRPALVPRTVCALGPIQTDLMQEEPP